MSGGSTAGQNTRGGTAGVDGGGGDDSSGGGYAEWTMVAGDQSTDQTGFVTVGAVYIDPADVVGALSLEVLYNTTVGYTMEVKLHDLTNAVDLFTILALSATPPTLATHVVTTPTTPVVYTLLIRLTAAPGPTDRAYCKMAKIRN